MTRETIRDHIPWDDYYETRDNNEEYKKENLEFLSSPNKKTIHHTKIDNTGTYDYLTSDIGYIPSKIEKMSNEITKLDFELQHIRDEIVELEARRINAITKQSKRKQV